MKSFGTLSVALGLVGLVGCHVSLRSILDHRTSAKGQATAPTSKPRYRPSHPSSSSPVLDPSAGIPATEIRVNSDTIKAGEMWRDLADELISKAADTPPESLRAYVERRATQWISDKITETLLHRQALLRVPSGAKENVDNYVDGELRKLISERYGGIQRRFEKYLAEQDRSLDDIRERIRRQVLISSFLEARIKPKLVEPTRAELLHLFKAQKDEWRRPLRHDLSLIEVRVLSFLPEGTDNPTREELSRARAAARDKIEAAQLELQEGVPFAKVARRYSEDLHARDGGAWGWVSRGSVRERYQPVVDVLYTLKKGQISDIIYSHDRLFLARCNDVDPGREPNFIDVQVELQQRYTREAYSKLVAEMIQKNRSEAQIAPSNLSSFHAAAVKEVLAHLHTDAP